MSQQNSFSDLLARLQSRRWPWVVIAFLSVALVVIAHNVFQVWLYMKPCEQCVYIRFGFLVIALGALFPILAGRRSRQPSSASTARYTGSCAR